MSYSLRLPSIYSGLQLPLANSMIFLYSVKCNNHTDNFVILHFHDAISSFSQILNMITEDIIKYKGTYKNLTDQCDVIKAEFNTGDNTLYQLHCI